MFVAVVFASIAFLFGLARGASWTSTPFLPLSIPLAVRSPYLSCWLPGGASGGNLAGQWPQFWNGNNLGWAGYVRVDGTPYVYLGSPGGATLATQTAFSFTSTQSTFTMVTGPVTLTVNFLSPIIARDLLSLSVPFSYMTVTAVANDGGEHTVEVYSDISAEWITGDGTNLANWTTIQQSNFLTHQIQLSTQTVFGEEYDRAQWGSSYYAASVPNWSEYTYQTGQDAVVRQQFVNYGTLTGTLDTNYRAVDDDWPVFAHAFNLGTVGTTASTPLVFAVGFVRDPAISYIIANDVMQNRRSYFFTEYSSVLSVINYFLSAYETALSEATSFDSTVQSDASAISENYAAITSIAARQAFGAIELTYGTSSTDIMLFLKEISSDGNVNTVDVIFPAFPIWLYSNPTLVNYILQPLLAYQATGQYPNKWAAHDIGSSYPVANGHNTGNDEAMPVEESGNMLIMVAAYIKATNDVSQAEEYYSLLTQWAGFLVDDSLIPANQLSTDDFEGTLANQTNLAIKGIVGLAAMAQIAQAVGNTNDYNTYLSTAQSYVPQFLSYATSQDGTHLDLSYGDDSSWGTTYNMYGDVLLGTNIFPQSVYEMQTAWYPGVALELGVPLDDRHTWSMTTWEIFMSACVTSTTVRDLFISGVLNYQIEGATNEAIPDVYDDTAGTNVLGFRARPVVGGHFANLALVERVRFFSLCVQPWTLFIGSESRSCADCT